MTQADKSHKAQYRTTEVFTRMGVAMEELLQATPNMVKDGQFDGEELHGKLKNKQAAA